jgi:hypothetical protein
MTEPAIFHITPVCEDGSCDQYRLDGELDSGLALNVIRETMVPNALRSGKPYIRNVTSWPLGEFLMSDVLPKAKTALQELMEKKNAPRP